MPRLRRARLSDNAGVSYVDPSTGQHYPLTEARWCADNGHYLNLAPAPGLGRADIDASRHSVWRYAKALRVDSGHAVSLGEGGTPLVAGEWKGASVHQVTKRSRISLSASVRASRRRPPALPGPI